MFDFFLSFFFFLRDRVSLALEAVLEELAFVDQAGLELRDPPACLPSAGVKGMCHHCLATYNFLLVAYISIYSFCVIMGSLI